MTNSQSALRVRCAPCQMHYSDTNRAASVWPAATAPQVVVLVMVRGIPIETMQRSWQRRPDCCVPQGPIACPWTRVLCAPRTISGGSSCASGTSVYGGEPRLLALQWNPLLALPEIRSTLATASAAVAARQHWHM
mmetsp:Transcript_57624/g.187202  ORF Transcript_57624/g.187202 Transcript_57624/m.187202 type:complete len:135 (-) Transcript_57624:483-887(-)